MSSASILEAPIGALKSTMVSSITCIRVLQSKLVSKSLESDSATAELKPTKRCLRFTEDPAGFMQEKVKVNGLSFAR